MLIGFFDAYDKNAFNNSEVVAKRLFAQTKNNPDYEIRLCSLKTVFDESVQQFETCLQALPVEPELVIGLGESKCNLKIEVMAKNLDQTYGPDNNGNERNQTTIIKGGPRELGFTYPLSEMYCSLNSLERKNIIISNNAGSFVCNNLAYQFSFKHPQLKFGFIHVPSHYCQNLEQKTATSVSYLQTMIEHALVKKENKRLPTTKAELELIRNLNLRRSCQFEFYKRFRAADEKDFWPLRVIRNSHSYINHP